MTARGSRFAHAQHYGHALVGTDNRPPRALNSSRGSEARGSVDVLPVRNYIPPDAEEFRWAKYIDLPNPGDPGAIVVSFKVPAGRNCVINRIANVYVGGGFEEGEGLVTWQLFQDATAFGTARGGVVMPNFDDIVASLGTVANPGELNGLLANEAQLVALIVFNDPLGPLFAGQRIGGLIGGYYYPTSLAPSTFAF